MRKGEGRRKRRDRKGHHLVLLDEWQSLVERRRVCGGWKGVIRMLVMDGEDAWVGCPRFG